MANPNAWAAIAVVVGGLFVSAAVVKYWKMPPPSVPFVTPPPSATGDNNAANAHVWDALTVVIDRQQCNQSRFEGLEVDTGWSRLFYHLNTVDGIEHSKAAIAEYRQLGSDLLADHQKRMEQGKSVIEQLQGDARSKAMADFLDAEHGIMTDDVDLQREHKDELDTVDRMLDLAEATLRKGKQSAQDAAQWNRFMNTLKGQESTVVPQHEDTAADISERYSELNHLVGRRPKYSYSRPAFNDYQCAFGTIETTWEVAVIERQAQALLLK